MATAYPNWTSNNVKQKQKLVQSRERERERWILLGPNVIMKRSICKCSELNTSCQPEENKPCNNTTLHNCDCTLSLSSSLYNNTWIGKLIRHGRKQRCFPGKMSFIFLFSFLIFCWRERERESAVLLRVYFLILRTLFTWGDVLFYFHFT